MKPKLLITGASGFLGWNICTCAQPAWDVHALVNHHPITIPGATMHRADITDPDALTRIFALVKPLAVIHAAAASQPNWCQEYPVESRMVNVDAAAAVARLCAEANIPCAFTSTDLVFDGCNPPYDESAPRSPISIYSEQKTAAEDAMRRIHPGVIICRMPIMFGDPGPAAQSFIQPWIAALKAGKELNLFVDEMRTPVSGRRAAAGLLLALNHAGSIPLLHLGGREKISRYDFGLLLTEILGLNKALIRASRQADVKMAAPRPADVSMKSELAYGLGYDPGNLKNEIEYLFTLHK